MTPDEFARELRAYQAERNKQRAIIVLVGLAVFVILTTLGQFAYAHGWLPEDKVTQPAGYTGYVPAVTQAVGP